MTGTKWGGKPYRWKKVCKNCGESFTWLTCRGGIPLTCSPKCSKELKRKRNRTYPANRTPEGLKRIEEWLKSDKRKEYMRAYARLYYHRMNLNANRKKMLPRFCKDCNRQFQPKSNTHVRCGDCGPVYRRIQNNLHLKRQREKHLRKKEKVKTYSDYLRESVERGQTPSYFLKT